MIVKCFSKTCCGAYTISDVVLIEIKEDRMIVHRKGKESEEVRLNI